MSVDMSLAPPFFWYSSPLGAVGFSFNGPTLWEVQLLPWEACPPQALPYSHEAQSFVQALHHYFEGQIGALGPFMEVPQRGTPFQREVWQALAQMAHQQHQTYSGIARLLERPKAVRAVGSAVGKNPLFLVLPCHRVLGANGALGGFSYGLEAKRWLLEHEARHWASHL
ncbi:MAG: methylated-DNA--[protein]-cysteine S-methyltransferase [Proteobacteria bacterium]|nr:methylated-DNA--[protein]-cysteine S-methyltransferase [Cystobacterineae bacterium]MCL2314862.1 methylated-DNA--[protein]-cysteine S-methyltransferase [Pseudomonadota bacterium]